MKKRILQDCLQDSNNVRGINSQLVCNRGKSRHPFSPLRDMCHPLSKLLTVKILKLQHHATTLINRCPKYCPSPPTAMALFRLRLAIARCKEAKNAFKTS
ncbi:hypothetical protein N0Y54_41955 [Nostoc punctiforme UO1]|uniref:hypothetical protein n=1 Tax=Nostoc punctiforme TaxID=272131 RepID=UPI00309F02ED